MLHVFRAPWVLPIAQPALANGWIAVNDGRIVAVGGENDEPPDASVEQVDGAILPGLVNAHIHLELSWMRDQVPPAPSMPQWVERLMALRRTVGHEPEEPIRAAVAEARAAGTCLVGDITNTCAAYDALADSELSAAIFRELLGFNVMDPAPVVDAARAQIEALSPIAWLRPSVVPHAPYSVSPALLRSIANASAGRIISVHVAESAEEIEFLKSGTGAWRSLLERLEVWTDQWQPPGTGPVEYLEAHGLVSERLVAVHCVQLTDEELQRLAAVGATVVTCPRSNRWVGAGVPPVDRFYTSGVRVAIGTDSLASVEDLNLFEEMRMIRELAPDVSAARILESATRSGAEALGFADELGTIEPGKRAELMAVRVPPHTEDVEEYLLTGIPPSSIRWLDVQ